jgi:heme/copper-type cytochrome/quinol oxidase subunit 3
MEVTHAAPNLPMRPPGRSIVFSGVALLALIELIVMAALVASYFYLRLGHPLWPPAGVDLPDLAMPAVAHGLLLASAGSMYMGYRGASAARLARVRVLLPAGLVLVLAYLLVTGWELAQLGYTHQSHAYGSMVWTLNGYEMMHAAGVLLAGLAVWVMLWVHPFGLRASAAVEALTLYWSFVAVVGVPLYLVLHVSPYVL